MKWNEMEWNEMEWNEMESRTVAECQGYKQNSMIIVIVIFSIIIHNAPSFLTYQQCSTIPY